MAHRNTLISAGLLLGLLTIPSPAPLRALGRAPAERGDPTPVRRPHTLLILPSRYTIVQLGFDLQKLRPISLIAYDDQAPVTEPALHAWDKVARDWTPIGLDQIRSGTLFTPPVAETVLVGSDRTMPVGLAEVAARLPALKTVPELNVAHIVNAVNESHDFSAREWQWLAARYRLKLQDLNYEQRRYGRFGKPGDERGTRDAGPARQAREAEEPLPPPRPVQTKPIGELNDTMETELPSPPDPPTDPIPPAPVRTVPEPADFTAPSEVQELPVAPEPDIPPEDK